MLQSEDYALAEDGHDVERSKYRPATYLGLNRLHLRTQPAHNAFFCSTSRVCSSPDKIRGHELIRGQKFNLLLFCVRAARLCDCVRECLERHLILGRQCQRKSRTFRCIWLYRHQSDRWVRYPERRRIIHVSIFILSPRSSEIHYSMLTITH